MPNIAPVYLTVDPDPTLLGFPVEFPEDDDAEPQPRDAAVAPQPGLQVVRRADPSPPARSSSRVWPRT